MAKISFRDKIDGNELDLSLNELVEVPVKELASSPKATHLDLSCNHIQMLPSNFATLTHLVKIDLSKNRLTELPHNFGNLVNLQYLDLYGNELKILPVSFCRLKNLRWLDLKNNPLDPKLKTVAGDCLDEKQCQACAKMVVAFMQNVDSDLEREKQKRLKEERDREAIRKAQEQQELEELRKQKKAEREKRKAEVKAKKEETEKAKKTEQRKNGDGNMEKNGTLGENLERPQKSGSWWTWCFWLFFILPVIVLSTFIAFHLYSGYNISSVTDLHLAVMESSVRLQEILILWWKVFLIPYSLSIKESIFEWLNSIFLLNSTLVL